ncbi:hypothetical protein INT43_001641 [Umbelopsis isabellina]|uniref:Alpha-L-fucosidase n=1 Tax=Mortierella isabellina TaxID=91625 RepID=A0A8H7PRW4_MORIS|nr:hypothetical protein INT43_001641 [Umbelopsis isabellina]
MVFNAKFLGLAIIQASLAVAYAKEAAIAGAQTPPSNADDILWYNNASGTEWITQGLPIGNGFQAATVFSGVQSDGYELNIDSLWTGGPFENPNYRGNNAGKSEKAAKAAGVAAVREDIWKNGQIPVDNATTLYGSFGNYASIKKQASAIYLISVTTDNYGSYRYMGYLYVNTTTAPNDVSNYRRWLDMDSALVGSSYELADGSTVNKTAFCSYPDHACVFHLSTTSKAGLNYTVNFYNEDTVAPHGTCMGNNGLLLRGTAEANKTAMEYEGQVIVTSQGGKLSCSKGLITVSGSKQFTAVVSAGTNFDQDNGNAQANFSFKGVDPHAAVSQYVKAASSKSFTALQKTHTTDYQKLYKGFTLSWNAKSSGKPTNELVADYRKNPDNPYLEWLAFNFGRYLLIQSSRPGSLPGNLQASGKWAQGLTSAWSSDYHLDINLQMKAAYTSGLWETAIPMVEYLAKNYIPRGEQTVDTKLMIDVADIHYSARGFIAHEENNIFGSTGPRSGGEYAIFPLGSTWMSLNAWDFFDYTQNTSWLQAQGWDILKGSSLFWIDYLTPDKYSNDGMLVAAPCGSSEQGNITFGCTEFQNVVWMTFQNTRKAYQYSGESNSSFLTELVNTINKTDPGLRVGSWGQLQEWKLDLDDPTNEHRHLSNLIGLYPGYMISSFNESKYKSAAEVSLAHRGPGISDSDAGWEKAWRAACWAALGNATQAQYELQLTIQRDFEVNLFDNYSADVFQIDANLGYPAAVMEMLFQDPDTTVGGRVSAVFNLLPAWPKSWSTNGGSTAGLRGRGGYSLSFNWDSSNTISDFVIVSDLAPAARQIQLTAPAWSNNSPKITSSGRDKPKITVSGKTLSFTAQPKTTYKIQ